MKKRVKISVRRPVWRNRAQRYILLSLLSFAASVSMTRLFLQLTGYPQIGNGELHIAHVLWGGLLLFIATLIPLLLANRWALTASAILSGVGVGLFIDEVGKFITQNNNYFFPAAAPIIYAFFLITVLLYTQVRRRRSNDPRSEMYAIIDELGEIIDRDLSEDERIDINQRLERTIQKSSDENLTRMAKSLEKFIESKSIALVPHEPDLIERVQDRWLVLSQRYLTERRLRFFLISGLAALGGWILSDPITIISDVHSPLITQTFMAGLFAARNIRGTLSLGSFEIRLGLEIAVGIILLLSAALMAMRKVRRAVSFGSLGLLLLLTIINLLVFYFDQFSTIINAAIQLVFLLAILYYRNHYFPVSSRL